MRTSLTAIVLVLTAGGPAVAGEERAALVHLKAGEKVKPPEVEPLERILAEELGRRGFGAIWAEPAMTHLAIGVDPRECVGVECRQKLATALEARLVAGGSVERRKDEGQEAVVELRAWVLDPAPAGAAGEATEECAACSSADVAASWRRVVAAAFASAGLLPTVASIKVAAAESNGPPAASPQRAPYAGPTDRRLWKFYAGGAAVILGGLGVTYILIDGPRYEERDVSVSKLDPRVRQRERFVTFVPGIVMASGALVLLGSSAALHYLEVTKGWGLPGSDAKVAVLPGAWPDGAGVHAVLRW